MLRAIAEVNSRIRLIALNENTGFAAGNNRGLEEAAGEFLVILNPDTIPAPGWMQRLMEPLRRDSRLGMTAPVTNYSGNETRIDFSYSNTEELNAFASERARRHFGEQRELTMAPLLCVMIPARVFKEVGPLDERFRVGMFEDDDYCLRVRKAGYRIATAEDCFVHHFGGGSFSQLDPQESLRIFAENRLLYETKWGIVWEEHRSREGVRPLGSVVRYSPRDFSATPDFSRPGAGRRASILSLSPPSTEAGQPMNRQPDGSGALVVHCVDATPDTVVRWNDVLLTTTFASPELLTALVPHELFARSGTARVTALNDFGISDAQLFTVL
jgi:hypothetical protein